MTDAAFDAAFGRFRTAPFAPAAADASGVFAQLTTMPTTPVGVTEDLTFTPENADMVNYGVPNGNFSTPPPHSDLALNDVTNKMPGWSTATVGAGSVNLTVDTGFPGGNYVTILTTGGAINDEGLVEAVIDIGGDNQRFGGDYVRVSLVSVGSNAQAFLRLAYLNQAGTIIGAEQTTNTASGSTAKSIAAWANGGASFPSNARYLRIRAGGVRSIVGGPAAFGSVNISGVRRVRATDAVGLADRVGPHLIGPADLFGAGIISVNPVVYLDGADGTDRDFSASGNIRIGSSPGTPGSLVLSVASFAAPALTLGTANAAGTATTTIRSDATILAFDATTPAAVGTAGAVGAATVAARRDHVHAHETAHVAHDTIWDTAGDLAVGTGADTAAKLAITVPAANILNVLGVVNGETTWSVKSVHDGTNPAAIGTVASGTSLLSSHRDHVHATGAGTPTTQAFSDAAAIGSGPAASMTDHKHGWPALGTTAAAIGTSAGGSATTPSKSDHVHATGAGTPVTQAFGDAAAIGAGPAAAMTNHVHGMPAAPTASSVGASANPHTAADHTDATNSFDLIAAAATLDSGTAATVGAAPNAIKAVALADAATQGCYWAFMVPFDWTSGVLSVQPIWVPGSTDAVSHAVRWSAVAKVITANNTVDVTGAGTTVTWTGQSQTRTANILVGGAETITSLTLTPANNANFVMLNLRRIGADAADTYVGVVNLVAVRVTYTANQ